MFFPFETPSVKRRLYLTHSCDIKRLFDLSIYLIAIVFIMMYVIIKEQLKPFNFYNYYVARNGDFFKKSEFWKKFFLKSPKICIKCSISKAFYTKKPKKIKKS